METRFRITGMFCAACSASVERVVKRLPGVELAEVNLLAGILRCEHTQEVTPEQVIGAVTKAGFGASVLSELSQKTQPAASQDESQAVRKRLFASVGFLLPLMYVSMGPMLNLPMTRAFAEPRLAAVYILTQFLLLLPILYLNRTFYSNGFKALLRGSPNMNSLIGVGSGASLLFGLFSFYRAGFALGSGDLSTAQQVISNLYFESSGMILTLVTVGKYLEASAKKKTGDALSGLRALAPKHAALLVDGTERQIPVEQLKPGDRILVRPGERIPVDGVIEGGHAAVDQSSLTGESVPAELTVGDSVLSASVDLDGALTVRAVKVGGETTLSQMISLVERAGAGKAPAAKLADKISGVFVPVVMGLAVLTVLIWLIAGQDFAFALTLGISVLVVSCPCALGLATPVAVTVALGRCARQGVLVKQPDALELLRSVDTVVLDKTGTLTTGRLSVTDVCPADGDEAGLLCLAAALERGSEHPVARAIAAYACERGCSGQEVTDFQALFGRGVSARIDGRTACAGNGKLMEEQGVSIPEEWREKAEGFAAKGKTPLFFAKGGRLAGVIAVADTPREDAAEAVAAMKSMGLRVLMLTGDNRLTANALADRLGLDEAVAEVLPADKSQVVERLRSEGRRVAMVGDGVNDAPALAAADVGIAIGGGADIALDAAELVLMRPAPKLVAETLAYSRRVRRVISQNLFWAFFYNLLGIPLAAGALYPAFGLALSPMIAAGMMSISSLFVVTNALRLYRK